MSFRGKKRLRRVQAAVLAGSMVLSMAPMSAFAAGEEQGPEKAKRTIMLYDCGSNLETGGAMATFNLMQVLESEFSADGDVRFIVMTGGSDMWYMEPETLWDPVSESIIEDGINCEYNQIWEAFGTDAVNEDYRSRMVLLDKDGVSGDGDDAKMSEDEFMSDPETLRGFINYAVSVAPAEKYDLILWDHGGGPTGGFAADEHNMHDEMMMFDGIIDAIGHNDVTKDGGRFDIVDFDACLMNSVEYNLALSDYVDYYIASAETEPGYGQYYTGWLNKLGEDPDYNGYELGKLIVDDYYKFYEEGYGQGQEGTLAVVDLKKLVAEETGFLSALLELDEILKEEAMNFNIYDELNSARRSLRYALLNFYDLGNFTSGLGVALLEKDDTEDNAYTQLSKKFYDILNDESVIYSRYTSGIKTSERFYRNGNGEVKMGKTGSSGMSIYFPGPDYTTDANQYYRYLNYYFSQLPDTDPKKKVMYAHMEVVLDYALILNSGYAVSTLVNEGVDKSDIDYQAVKNYWYRAWDGSANEDLEWICDWLGEDFRTGEPTGIKYLMDCIGGEDAVKEWLVPILLQQAAEAVDIDNVEAYTVKEPEGERARVKITDTKKQVFDSVNLNVYAELPIARDWFLEDDELAWLISDEVPEEFRVGEFQIGAIPGQVDYELVDWTQHQEWLKNDSCVWDLSVPDYKWWAVSDKDGVYHVAEVQEYQDAVLVPATCVLAGNDSSKENDMYLCFESGKLTALFMKSPDGSFVSVLPEDLKVDLEVTLCRMVFVIMIDIPVPMSKPFLLTAENTDSISLDYVDIDEIPDIQDTTGDGKKLIYETVIKDIYDADLNVQDKVDDPAGTMYGMELAETDHAVYNGTSQKPVVKVEGKKLTEDTDYVIYLNDDWDYKDAGEYAVSFDGMGNYVGFALGVPFVIDPAPMSKVTVTGISDRAYTGKAITQTPVLTYNGMTLKEGTDYTVSYKHNIYAGTATVTFTGMGNYKNAISRNFKITKTGWRKDSKGWWYDLGGGQYLKNCWKKIDGQWYYFHKSGYLACGEYVHGWWLNKKSCTCTWEYQAKWHKNKNGWWYGDASGWYAKNQTIIIDGVQYTFDKRGYCIED